MTIPSVTKELKGAVFETGYKVFEEKGLAIIWMSVGNPYFNPEVIKNIVEFCSKKFSKIRILVPFEPAQYTFQALSNDENKAKSKARLNSNRLKNHTQRVLDQIKNKSSDIKIINWSEDILPKEEYKKSLKEIETLYSTNKLFQKDCNETTREVLNGKTKENIDFEKAVKIGVKYLLEELAFVLASPLIFDVSKTAYIYHHRWPIYENLVNGEYDKKVRNDVGFLLVK